MTPDFTRSGQGREEETLATEESVLNAPHQLNVVVHARLDRDEAAGIEFQCLTGRQGAFHQSAAGMDERYAIAGQSLHDEPFTAEQADADFLLKGDTDLHAARGAEERILLTNEFAAELGQVHREYLAGERRRERDFLPARPP